MESKLLEYDPEFVRDEDLELEQRKASVFHRLHFGPKGYTDTIDKAKANQIFLNTELPRVLEILFQPHIVGIDQAGLMEVVATVMSLFSAQMQLEISQNVLVCGGLSKIRGLNGRLVKELTRETPSEATIGVTIVKNCIDSWCGAALWTIEQYRLGNILNTFVSKTEYVNETTAKKDSLFNRHYSKIFK